MICKNCYKPINKKELEENTCSWCGAETKESK